MNWSKSTLSTIVKSAMVAGVSGSILIPDQGFSAPQGGVVSRGDGSISSNNKVTTVQQNSSALVVDWQSFNVAQDELVKFEHPSAKATTLNRIHDQNASQILGRVEGRGKVLLINPNGIVFGEGSSVNLGSLVASTKQISDDDFMAGNIVLQDVDDEGVVVNRGTLTAATGGAVVLVGDTVVNEGVIQATKGSVVLASGKSATLDFDGDGLLQFKLSGAATEGESDTAVLNAGLITAADGSVLLTADAARDVFANVVNNTGVIEAKGIDTSGGKIRLIGEGGAVRNSGKLIATSATGNGGDIDVSGDRTIIDTGALLDASGETSGGNIRVGGGYQGQDTDITNARETLVAESAELKADAGSGDGGRVIVWADESTSYKGSISARGGQNQGNGGFAEVSGKEGLQFSGDVDLSAPSGEAGTLLIDPRDIRIVQNGNYSLTGDVEASDPPASDARIDVDDLILLLETANVSLQASDNIFVETSINTTGNSGGVVSENNLALDAGTDISIDGAIHLKSGASLSLKAGGEITQSESIIASSLNIDGNATLDHTGNDFNTVTLSGNSATSMHLRDANDLSIGELNVDNLSITTGGALTQSGAFVVANTASIDTGSATLTQDNNFNTLSLNGGSAQVTDVDSIVLDSSNLTGTLAVTASVNITQSGALDVGGASTLSAAGDITLENASNDFSSLSASAINLSVRDANALNMGAVNVNDLSVTTAGTLTQTGAFVVANTANIDADTVTLTQDNNFNTLSMNGGSAQINDIDGIVLGSSNLTGTLAVTAGGNITQSGALDVDGTSTLTAAGDISLEHTSNDFSSLSASAANLSVRDANALSMGALNVDDLSVTTGGALTQTGAFVVANTASIDAGSSVLTQANNFNTLSLSGDSAQINDVDGIVLGSSNLTGILSVTAVGSITQSGTIDVDGASTLSASGDITLEDIGNDFNSLSASATNLSISDVNALSIGALNVNDLSVTTGGALTQTGAFIVANSASVDASSATLTQANNFNTLSLSGGSAQINDADGIVLGSTNLTGSLVMTTAGDITQSDVIEVDGATSLTATTADITLDNSSNDFFSLALNAVNAAIEDSNGLTLAASVLSGTLDVTSGGDLTQSDAIDVDGATTLTANGDITLEYAGNDFSSLSASATNLSVRDVNALSIAALNVNDLDIAIGGDLSQTGAFIIANTASIDTGSATLTQANNFNTLSLNGGSAQINDIDDIVLGSSYLTGALAVTAAGNITQSGSIDVDGATSLTASADITLDNSGNDFLSLALDAVNAVIEDSNSLMLAASTLIGNLDISSGGDLTQSDAIDVDGATTLTANGDIRLENAANDFDSLTVSATNLSVRDINALSISALNVNDLGVITGGELTQTGAFIASNTTSIDASSAILTQSNDFNTLSLNGGSALINDVNGIELGNTDLTGSLTVTAGANITQSGVVEVDGLTDLTATNADITLENAGNDFSSVSASATNVRLSDINALSIGALNVNDLSITTAGVLTQTGKFIVANTAHIDASSAVLTQDNNFNTLSLNGGSFQLNDVDAIELGSSDLTGALVITAAGNITQSGAVEVDGTTNLTATNADITLENASNDFSAVSAIAANVYLRDSNALSVGALNVTDLSITTGGALTQTGAFIVANTANIDAGSAILTQANNFNTLSLNGGSVQVNDMDAIELGSSDLTGVLIVTAAGNITQSGAVEVDGTTSFTATNADITLENASNDFSNVSAIANNLRLRDANSMSVGALSVNDLNLTTGGALTQDGAFVVANTANVDAGSAILTQANNFKTLSLNGGSAQVNDANGVVLGNTDLTGILTVTAAGSITQSGAIEVDGATSLTATNADITLDNTANDFSSLSATANNLSVRDTNALSLGALNVNDLSITAGGTLIQTGEFVVNNIASIDAGSAILTQGNNFNTLSLNGGSAQVNDIDGIVLGSTDLIGSLTVTAAGNITQSDAIEVDGATSLTAANADIILDNSSNDFFSIALNAVNAVIEDSNGLTLAASALSGTLGITSGGDLIQSDAVDVDGATTLTVTGDITLENSGNDFNSLSATATNLSVRDTNALSMGIVNVNDLSVAAGGALTQTGAFVVANSASIDADTATLTQANNFNTLSLNGGSAEINDVDGIVLGSTGLTGTLTVTAVGNISQSGSVEVDGATSLIATNADISLEHAGNDFSSLSASANNVSLRDANALSMGAVNVNDLSVTAGGSLTQTGVFAVANAAEFNASSTTLTLANNFNTLSLNGGSAQVNDVDGIVLGSTDLTGNLTVIAAGNIMQSDVVEVDGATSLMASNADITLDNSSNDFFSIALNAVNAVIEDSNGLTLAASALSGTLGITSGGDLIQSDAVDVDGATNLTATGDITLENAGNDFNSLAVSATDVILRDANSLIGGTISADNLNITVGSDLTQTGAFVITDMTNIEADSITLTQANNFNSLSLLGESALVNDVDGINLGQSDLTTSLAVTAAGDISQNGALSVPLLSLDAGAGNVTLEHVGNQLDSLSIAANQVSIRDQGALELQAVNAVNLKAVVDSAITQQAGTVLTVTDELSLYANSITLDNANQIHAVELLGGGIATLKNAADLELSDIDVSDLTLEVTGTVSNTSASNINVANAFTVTNTGNIDLGRISGDQVNLGSVMLNSGDVILHENSSTLLKTSSASALTIHSNGDVRDDGDLFVSGLLTVDASGDIELGTLGAAEDTRFGRISLRGANISLIEEDAIFVNRAVGDSVELISETGGIKTNGTQIVAQSLLRLDAGPNQDIGDLGNLVDFTLDISGSLIIDARSAYLTQSAADFSRQVALFSSNALIRSEANLVALTRSEIQFLSYLLGLDDALFNEFVTIFDVANEGMLLPEDQREEQLSWYSDDGRYLVSVDRNARFEYYHDQWAKYGNVFSLAAMNAQPGTMEWL